MRPKSETASTKRKAIALAVVAYGVYLATWAFLSVLYAEPSFVQTTTQIQSSDQLVAIEPPPFSPEVFPCSDCHEKNDPTVDTTRTDDLFHDEIVLEHDPENLWCYSCHTPANRDVLHLSNGQPVPFTESYRLCGQCHGTQLRDWRAGDHGKRTGFWLGEKTYLLCAHCHSPHSPSFQPIEPLPPPIRQEFIK